MYGCRGLGLHDPSQLGLQRGSFQTMASFLCTPRPLNPYLQHWQGREAVINKADPASGRIITNPPRHTSVPNLEKSESKILRIQFERRDTELEIFEGEGAQVIVQ